MNIRQLNQRNSARNRRYRFCSAPQLLLLIPAVLPVRRSDDNIVQRASGASVRDSLEHWIKLARSQFDPVATAQQEALALGRCVHNLSNAEYRARRRGKLQVITGMRPVSITEATKSASPVAVYDITFELEVSYAAPASEVN